MILGGHSLGASLTAAYAAWDFHGKPGFKDVDGLVLIDGGLLGSFDAYDLAQAQEQIANLQTSNPFHDLFGNGIAESAGLFAEVGGIYARLDADGERRHPAGVPVPARRVQAAGHGHQPGPVRLRLRPRHVALGAGPAGQPRRPRGERRPARLGRRRGYAGRPARDACSARSRRTRSSGSSRKRLTIDTNGADQMKRNDVAKFLGLRLEHTRQIDVPIYAFQTTLTDGDVLRGASGW